MRIKPIIFSYKPLKNFNSSVSKPNIETKSFNLLSFNQVSFEGFSCGTNEFDIKNIEGLYCPVCGGLMLTKKQREEIVKDISSKKGIDLVRALEKYEDERNVLGENSKDNFSTAKSKKSLYKGNKQEVVNILKKAALEHSDYSLEELVCVSGYKSLDELIPQQIAVLSELNNCIETMDISSSLRRKYEAVILEHRKRILGKSQKRFNIIALTQDIMYLETKRENKIKMAEILSHLPNSKTSVSSFFVNYSDPKYSSKAIARALIENASVSAEHIKTKSSGGANNTSNYFCDCKYCNEKRGDMPFNQWQKGIPNFKKKLENHFKIVHKVIAEGNLREYDTYCNEAIETIRVESRGEIDISPLEDI